ncbi:8847_t:CDS:2, partial [Racocetra fulgida]
VDESSELVIVEEDHDYAASLELSAVGNSLPIAEICGCDSSMKITNENN